MIKGISWRDVGLIAFGACLGYLAFQSFFSRVNLDEELTLGDVSVMITTLLAAAVLAYAVGDRTQAKGKEKDLLLRHSDLILGELKQLSALKESGAVTELAACLKRLSVASQALNRLLTHLKYTDEIIKSADISKAIVSLRKQSTLTPIAAVESHAQKVKMAPAVRDGIIALTSQQKNLLDNLIQSTELRILQAQLEINKS